MHYCIYADMEVSQVNGDVSSRCLDKEWQKDERSMECNVQLDSVSCLLTLSDGCGLEGEGEVGGR